MELKSSTRKHSYPYVSINKAVLKTPVIAGVFALFLICALNTANAAEFQVWQERYHPSAEHISLRVSGGIRDLTPGGYDQLDDSERLYFVYKIALMATEEVPLLSQLSWESSLTPVFTPDIASHSTESQYTSIYTELRLPVKVNFLAWETSLFLQYRYSAQNILAWNLNYENITYAKDGGVGSDSHFFAVAMDTPVTRGGPPDSFSRFGLFFKTEKRARYEKNNSLLLPVREDRGGFFFDITKPAFFDGFVVNIHAAFGLLFRNVLENPGGYKTSDFVDTTALITIDLGLEAGYRFKLGESAGLKLAVGYDFATVSVFVSERSSFDNKEPRVLSASLAFDYLF